MLGFFLSCFLTFLENKGNAVFQRPLVLIKRMSQDLRPRLHEIVSKLDQIHLDLIPFRNGVYTRLDPQRIQIKSRLFCKKVDNLNRKKNIEASEQFSFCGYHFRNISYWTSLGLDFDPAHLDPIPPVYARRYTDRIQMGSLPKVILFGTDSRSKWFGSVCSRVDARPILYSLGADPFGSDLV